MRINLTEYRPASTSVLGPVGGSTVAPAETATGQTLNDIKNQRDQQIMDMITGGLDAVALVNEANKKIKAGEDEVTMLKAEEDAKQQSENAFNQVSANLDVTVGSEDNEFTYSVDTKLGTYKHQDWNYAKENIENRITNSVIDKIIEENGEIDEKLELKLRKRISMSIDRDIHKMESIVLDRSAKAVDLAIQEKADQLMGTVRVDSSSQVPLSEQYQTQMTSFITHIKQQVENDVITPEHGQKWVDKIQREYSTQITESFLKSGKPEDLKKFKALQETELYKDVPPLKKIQFNSEYLKDKDSLKQQELLKLALQTIDDTDNHYEGSGGHLLLNEILGTDNWEFNEETGKVNVKKMQLGSDSSFKGINNTNLRSIVNSAVSRLESDWKNKTTLTGDEGKLLAQEISNYENQISNVFVHGFGGTLGDGMDLKTNDLQVPRNFLGSNTFWNQKKVDKSYPFMTESVQSLNNILTDTQSEVNAFIEFKTSKKDFQKKLVSFRNKLSGVKNNVIRGYGQKFLSDLEMKLSKRISIMDVLTKGKTNFMNVWFNQNISPSVRAELTMASPEYKGYRKRAFMAHLIYVGLDPNSKKDKYKHRDRYFNLMDPYGYKQNSNVEKK
jgi:hypothetical protein